MKFLIGFILFFFAGILPVAGQVPDSARYKSLDPYYFNLQYLKEDSALILDVRMPFEFRGRRIKDAINVPSSRELNSLTDTLSREYALLLYCSTDYRSRSAAEALYEKGFRKLYNLEGGIVAWKKDNMTIQKGRVRKAKQ